MQTAHLRVTVIRCARIGVGAVDDLSDTRLITQVEDSRTLPIEAFVIHRAGISILAKVIMRSVAASTRAIAQVIGAGIAVITIPPDRELTEPGFGVAIILPHFSRARVSVIANDLRVVAHPRETTVGGAQVSVITIHSSTEGGVGLGFSRGTGLGRRVAAPAKNLPLLETAIVGVSGGDPVPFFPGCGRRKKSFVVLTPAEDRTIRSKSAGVRPARFQLCEGLLRRFQLVVGIASPALGFSVFSQSTNMPSPGDQLGEWAG